MGLDHSGGSLRQALRAATAKAHDQLDGTMRTVAGWQKPEDYARFLSLQYAARVPVEAWLSQNASADLRPPEQAPLIASDLASMGHALPTYEVSFTPPAALEQSAERARALGIAWVLAGSSLGNRAILAEIRRKTKAQGLTAWPEEFLGDDGMLDFWKHLRSQIEGRAEMDALEVAIEAAAAVFDHFIAHAQAAHSPCALTV